MVDNENESRKKTQLHSLTPDNKTLTVIHSPFNQIWSRITENPNNTNLVDQRVNRNRGIHPRVSETAQVLESLSLHDSSPSLSLSLSSYRETRCSTTTIPASNLHRSFIQRGGTQGGGKSERCSIFRSNDVEKRWMKAPREIFRRVVFRFQFSKRWWTRLPTVAPSVANRGTTLDFFLSFSFLFHESRVKRNDSRGQSSII